MNIPEKHHYIAHAWVDGAEIEVYLRGGWCPSPLPDWHEFRDYRLKPKAKVKKWRWVFKDYGSLEITNSHYTESQAAFMNLLEKVVCSEMEEDA